MLRAEPHNIFSWDFTVYEGDTVVAEIDMRGVFREKGVLTIGGIDCAVYREGLASGAFVLEAGDHRLLHAVKPSALFRAFDITVDGRALRLEARSALQRAFVVCEGGYDLGTIAPHHAFTRKLTADLPDDLPLAVRVFIIWLVLLLWKRAANSS